MFSALFHSAIALVIIEQKTTIDNLGWDEKESEEKRRR